MDVMQLHRVLIVGMGTSGLAAARLAARDGAEVWVTDQRQERDLAHDLDQLPSGVRKFFGGHPEACIEGADLVIASPGVAPEADILQWARRRGIGVLTEVEFAWQHVPTAPMVAVIPRLSMAGHH